jgi:hypothetical protein
MLLCAIGLACCLQFGCGGSGGTKKDDAAEVEKMRQEHQDMSNREMSNEG